MCQKLIKILLLISILSSGPPALALSKITFLLSWNLKPYWDFVAGFRSQNLFKDETLVLKEENFWLTDHLKKAEYIVAVGHRAFEEIAQLSPQAPIFVALVVAPELLPLKSNLNLRGGLYLRLPPEIFLPLLKRQLYEFFGRSFTIGIPFSSPENEIFVKRVIIQAEKQNLKIIPLDLRKGPLVLQKSWDQIEVLYLIPDPFLESEEAIANFLKKAVLNNKIVVGYNRFFLKKGALIAFIIDYKEAGRKSAQILSSCLKENAFCGWHPAPFKVKINKKLLNFYRSIFSH